MNIHKRVHIDELEMKL